MEVAGRGAEAHQGLPRILDEPYGPVHDAAPALRLRHRIRDSRPSRCDGPADKPINVAVAADRAVEDDPIVWLDGNIGRVADDEGCASIGKVGGRHAIACCGNTRRREVNPGRVRGAALQEGDGETRSSGAELEDGGATLS